MCDGDSPDDCMVQHPCDAAADPCDAAADPCDAADQWMLTNGF